MTDPKARKVIILENPMLPLRIKQTVAKTLFEYLQIPSLSFALSPLCALLSIGRATGLVVDVGNLETCLLPVRLLLSISEYKETLSDRFGTDLRVKTALLPPKHQPCRFQTPFSTPSRSSKSFRYIHSKSPFKPIRIAAESTRILFNNA